MLDDNFLEFLEYTICKAYLHTGKRDTKLWCRSVSLSESKHFYSKDFVKYNKRIRMKAFVGKFGKTEFDLHLEFGDESATMFAKNLDIKRCVPTYRNTDSVVIDFENNLINISLP